MRREKFSYACGFRFLLMGVSAVALVTPAVVTHASSEELRLEHAGTVKIGAFAEGAAEIAAFDAGSEQLFVVNDDKKSITVIDVADPAAPQVVKELSVGEHGKGPTCVAASGGLVAATVQAEDKQAPGKVVFWDVEGNELAAFHTGALPDHVSFSPDGKVVLVANEGEPSEDYQNDPEGTLTLIELSDGKGGIADASVKQIGFGDLDAGALDPAVRLFGPEATPAQDLEPEFIAFAPDGSKAFVILQENNAAAVVDLSEGKVSAVKSFGFKDHSQEGNGFDASNKTDGVNIRPWPVKGMYQPDSAVTAVIGGKTFLFTANEGDARDYEGYSEEVRVEDLKLDAEAYPNAAELQDEKQLGRLKTTTALGDTDGDGDVDQIFSYGARSFSIWDENLELVYDSGDSLEKVTSERLGNGFNADNEEQPSFKDRSDDKGPEPEAIDVATLGGRTYAFIGMERVGGVAVFDVSDPQAPEFVLYENRRDFEADPDSPEAGDLGPECVLVIPADRSPSGAPLLVVASEVSGTVTLYEIK